MHKTPTKSKGQAQRLGNRRSEASLLLRLRCLQAATRPSAHGLPALPLAQPRAQHRPERVWWLPQSSDRLLGVSGAQSARNRGIGDRVPNPALARGTAAGPQCPKGRGSEAGGGRELEEAAAAQLGASRKPTGNGGDAGRGSECARGPVAAHLGDRGPDRRGGRGGGAPLSRDFPPRPPRAARSAGPQRAGRGGA